MSKTAWEPAPPHEAGICGSCKHLNKNVISRREWPTKYPCMKSSRKHTEFDKCDVLLDQEAKPAGCNALGNNIALWLEKRGKTQRELADEVGATTVSISRYISGSRVPSGPLLYKIARALRCSVEELMQVVNTQGQ